MFGSANDSTILRLRVNGSDLDPLALRGRVESLFNDVSMQPRLPPSATLFIRRLKDPLPGLLQLDTTFPRAPQAWRHAFQTRFDQLVSSAARPAFGYVADSAESVVFYDYAELLASLSADWCRGDVATRWWWQSLIKRGDIARMIKQLWRERVEYAPAALQHLVQRDAVVEFVSRLSDAEAHEMVQRVVHVFALHALRRIVEPRIARIEASDRVVEVDAVVEELRVLSVMPPWKYMVPESETPRLRPAQKLFVGITLMVQRAPARVRTLSFAREVERWIEPAFVDVSNVSEFVPDQTTESKPNPPETHVPIRADQPLAPSVPVASPPSTQQESVSSAAKIGNAVFTYEELETVSEVTTVVNEPPAPVVHHIAVTPTPETIMPVSETLDAVAIETELGGLFYLINLAIFMEIYNDFTSPVEQFHDDLCIWDFVTIVGHEITDLDDPIWSLLENLAEPDKTECPNWLLEMLPDIKTRLRQALGINDEDDLAQLLLHHHAKVIIAPTHIDVFFALATHPIEIRFSGLDRDPGWVPAAGRFIAFHYD